MIQALGIFKTYFTLKYHVFNETRAVMPLVPKFKSVKYGKGSLSYEGAFLFLWNILGNSYKLSESQSDLKDRF